MTEINLTETGPGLVSSRPASWAEAVVRVSDAYLDVAVQSILRDARVAVVASESGQSYLITDDRRMRGLRTLLITDESPGTAQRSLEELQAGQFGGLVSRARPDDLPFAIQALERGLTCVPSRLLSAARSAPRVGERQLRVLQLVAAGLPNARIAERLSVSEATIKREVTALLRAFRCNSRMQLVTESTEAGFV